MNIYQELREIAEKILKEKNLKNIPIEFKQVQGGRFRRETKKITIPLWALTGKKEYAIYYIIHELTHYINGSGHSQEFKKIESEILRQYNIIPIYAKAYAKELRDLNGNKICGKYGK